ncbi:MAG: hypothetical protein HKL80_03350 [Acidimicrobiales bacterium]|nr:hypothetical protein [Acidimicrobiales bacterium]
MSEAIYDLWFDPNMVDGDLVVECWISHGPRSSDNNFNPLTGDSLLAGDGEVDPISALVLRREGNRVWIQLRLQSRAPLKV